MNVKKFLRYHLRKVAGHRIPFGLVHRLFLHSQPNLKIHKVRFSRELHKAGYCTGTGNNNVTFVINVTLDPMATPTKRLKLTAGRAKSRKRISK